MKFNLVEGERVDFDKIKEDFKQDYLNPSMKNDEIREKYDLSHNEFRRLCSIVKDEINLSHRKTLQKGKYYYKYHSGYSIQKRVNGETTYFGSVPTIEMAKKAIQLCEELNWEVQKCKKAIWNLKLCN